MASWNGTKIVRFEPKPAPEHPEWVGLDCGCCGGIEWSQSEVAVECQDCSGRGIRWVHGPTGTVAEWPGGYLLGKASRREVDAVMRALDGPERES